MAEFYCQVWPGCHNASPDGPCCGERIPSSPLAMAKARIAELEGQNRLLKRELNLQTQRVRELERERALADELAGALEALSEETYSLTTPGTRVDVSDALVRHERFRTARREDVM